MNKAAPTATLYLDKERNFKLDFKAFMAFEKISGKNVLSTSVWQDMSASNIVALLWAGLLHEEPTLTMEQVAGFIHPGNLQEVVNAIQQVFQLSMPNNEQQGEGEPSPLAANPPLG